MRRAKVYLIGAGPGDPELLTLKAVEVHREGSAALNWSAYRAALPAEGQSPELPVPLIENASPARKCVEWPAAFTMGEGAVRLRPRLRSLALEGVHA